MGSMGFMGFMGFMDLIYGSILSLSISQSQSLSLLFLLTTLYLAGRIQSQIRKFIDSVASRAVLCVQLAAIV
ncbi:hypothetical protein BDF14DRAFT_1836579 [Spinellus fusiger]|nr:hypothetical protein BDF14DRAFT_1836579 [Spinellus fusiger]